MVSNIAFLGWGVVIFYGPSITPPYYNAANVSNMYICVYFYIHTCAHTGGVSGKRFACLLFSCQIMPNGNFSVAAERILLMENKRSTRNVYSLL